jgi:hypothetical protein
MYKTSFLVLGACLTVASAAYAADELPARGHGRKAALQQQILQNGGNSVMAGGNCTTPTQFSSVPYSDSGTTVGATNIISSIPSGCSDYTTVAGPEAVYSFVAGNSANLTFTVEGFGDYDTSIYLVSTCNSGTTCIAGADSTYYGAETFSVSSLTSGTTYYLHVDSFYSSASAYGSGDYTLDVTGTLPVSLQEFSID